MGGTGVRVHFSGSHYPCAAARFPRGLRGVPVAPTDPYSVAVRSVLEIMSPRRGR